MDHLSKVQHLCKRYREDLGKYRVHKQGLSRGHRIKGVSISDLHIPFLREDLIKEIIHKHSGEDFCVVNGDLFDNSLISTFLKEKEIPFAVEYAASMEIVRLLAKNFKRVVLVDGNHDSGRFTREMAKLNTTLLFLVKSSPLKYMADGHLFSPEGKEMAKLELPNVEYAGDFGAGWWCKIGKTLFAHRLRGFKRPPMANACFVTDWFLNQGTDFQCIINGHSHRVGTVPYKKKLVIDQGCLCLPMEYETNGSCGMVPVDLGYATIEMDLSGNVDFEATKPIYLGTYQTT